MKKIDKKKLCILSFEFPPMTGGAGEVAKTYARLLSENSYDVAVVACYAPIESDFKNEKVNYEKSTFNYSPFWPSLMYKAVPKGMDFYILNDPSAIYCAGMFFSKKKLNNSIVFMHGSEIENVFLSVSLKRKITLYRMFYKKTLHYCKKIIVPSNYFKEQLLGCSTFPRELESKIEVIYAPIKNISNLGFSKTEISSVEDNSINIISVSRVVERKGYKAVYSIVRDVINSGFSVRWDIVGDGDYIDILRNMTKRDGLESYIIFHGRKDGSELASIYSKSSVFVLLSEYDESYGLAYLEALSQGVPVVAYNRAGPSEIINYKCGFLIETPQELYEILTKRKYNKLLGRNCIEYSKRFNGASSLSKISEFIESH